VPILKHHLLEHLWVQFTVVSALQSILIQSDVSLSDPELILNPGFRLHQGAAERSMDPSEETFERHGSKNYTTFAISTKLNF